MYLQNILVVAQTTLSQSNFIAFKHYVKKIVKINDADILLNSHQIKLTSSQIKKIFKFIQKVNKGYPLAYLFKEQDFGSNTFFVNSHTLIPREDSFALIQNVYNNFTNKQNELNILELGIGSGCLIITLLKHYVNATGVGVDINSNTLCVAKKNLKKFKLQARCKLLCGDMLSGVSKKFDVIISNPPYIANDDTHISTSVKKYEPSRALFALQDGLYFYHKIFSKSHLVLKNGGKIIVEVGFKQNSDVEKIANIYGYKLISIEKDSQGIKRSLAFV